MAVLLKQVVAEAKEAAVLEAREEAKSSTIAALTQEHTQQQTGAGYLLYVLQLEPITLAPQGPVFLHIPCAEDPPETVSADDPRVKQAVKEAEDKARTSNISITIEIKIKALRQGIQAAEQKRRESDPAGPL